MKVRYIYITQLLISLIPVKENASEKYIGFIFLPFVIAIVSSIMIVLFQGVRRVQRNVGEDRLHVHL